MPNDMSQAAVFKRHILTQKQKAGRDKAPVVAVAKKVRIAKGRYSRWRYAEEDLERMSQTDATTHAAVIRTKQGNLIQNPMVGIANSARREMQRLAAEFGLSPSARTQIEANPYPDNPIDREYFRA